MAKDRNDLKVIAINSDKIYQDIFKKRKVDLIVQYNTPDLVYPTP